MWLFEKCARTFILQLRTIVSSVQWKFLWCGWPLWLTDAARAASDGLDTREIASVRNWSGPSLKYLIFESRLIARQQATQHTVQRWARLFNSPPPLYRVPYRKRAGAPRVRLVWDLPDRCLIGCRVSSAAARRGIDWIAWSAGVRNQTETLFSMIRGTKVENKFDAAPHIFDLQYSPTSSASSVLYSVLWSIGAIAQLGTIWAAIENKVSVVRLTVPQEFSVLVNS